MLKWTAKVPLSSRIIDPLGIYVLKHLETYYLPGITTQTDRLRYFTLLTWAWKAVAEKRIKSSQVFIIEKIATLAAGLHHSSDTSPPNAIRNRESAIDFLRMSNEPINVDEYKKYGRNNKIGYGNYYYRGPLVTLQICAKNTAGKYVFSKAGEQIASLFDKIVGKNSSIFLKKELSKKDLLKLESICFCTEKIPVIEQQIWRLVFFGFTLPTSGFGLTFNAEEYRRFEECHLDFPSISPHAKYSLDDYLKNPDKIDSVLDNNIPEKIKKNIARRSLLFLAMQIINDSNPRRDGEPFDQIMRDCLYFHQFLNGSIITKIDFGPLTKYVGSWETYVHNLYYINFLELFFFLLLKSVKLHPFGTNIAEISKFFDTEKIAKFLSANFKTSLSPASSLEEIELCLKKLLGKKKTSLTTALNEKLVAFKARDSLVPEERIANLVLLFLLLKNRFKSFSQIQQKSCGFQEELLFSIVPKKVYGTLSKGNVTTFINSILTLVKNRHKLIASKKFAINGTKAWLFTEEDDRLFYYGRDWVTSYRQNFYREAKWNNVRNLLVDMGLVETKQRRDCLTQVGRLWLKRIF